MSANDPDMKRGAFGEEAKDRTTRVVRATRESYRHYHPHVFISIVIFCFLFVALDKSL